MLWVNYNMHDIDSLHLLFDTNLPKSASTFNFCSSCINYSGELLYAFADDVLSFDFIVYFYSLFGFSYVTNLSFFYKIQILKSFLNEFNLLHLFFIDFLFNSIIYDEINFNLTSSANAITHVLRHPELHLVAIEAYKEDSAEWSFNIYEILLSSLLSEKIFAASFTLFDFLFTLFVVAILWDFYFSPYNTSTDNTLIDNEYLIACSLVEAEKEIGSWDDIVMALPIALCMFSWYFLTHVWVSWNYYGLSLDLYVTPVFVIIVFMIPSSLLYYYGINFASYLRGVAATSSLLFELLNDTIAVLIFYTRISVQFVRVVLMLLVVGSLNELSLLLAYNERFWVGDSSIWDAFALSTICENFWAFWLIKFPSTIAYIFYEVMHLYFVASVQFFSFFAIVFWLFLFLYTFFGLEKLENYFHQYRFKNDIRLHKKARYTKFDRIFYFL